MTNSVLNKVCIQHTTLHHTTEQLDRRMSHERPGGDIE